MAKDKAFIPNKKVENKTTDIPPVLNDIKTLSFKEYQKYPEIITLPEPFKYVDQVITKAYIKEVTGAEEEEYNTPQNKENFGRLVTSICSACITQFNEDITPQRFQQKPIEWREIIRSMPMSDRDYLLFCIYILSEGTEIELKDVTCPNPSCRSRGFIVDIKEQGVRYLEKPFEPFEITIPKGYKFKDKIYNKVKIGTSTGIMQERVFPLFAQSPSKADTLTMASCIDTIYNDKNDAQKFNMDVARSLTKADRTVIMEAISESTVGIELIVDMQCKCGRQFPTLVTVTDFFVRW